MTGTAETTPDGAGRRPSILFLHQNFPAQFGGIAAFLQRRGWDVLYATARPEIPAGRITTRPDGLRVVGFRAKREPSPQVSRYLRAMETAVVNGQSFASLAIDLRRAGVRPDIICAHSGWGTGSFAKVVWPEARFVPFVEWWYAWPPRDVAAAPDPNGEDRHAAALCRNLPFLLDLQTADAILVPTVFQARDLPAEYRPKLTVMHDGVDCAFFAPDPSAAPPCLSGRVPEGARLVTYATRGMEPQRGFPEFMAALERLQRTHPDVHCVIAGEDTVHYEGASGGAHRNYKAEALARHAYDMDRLHFVGRLPFPEYRDLLRRSDAHVYLTRPFVLSWSLVEAMATACPLVVSDVEPVREALPGADMASFVDPSDPDRLAAAIGAALDDPAAARARGRKARDRALAAYAADHLHPAKEAFFRRVMAGG